MHHNFYSVTHTCTPRMQWFRGSLLCVLVCANRHLRSFVDSIHITHIKGEPSINHWTQNPNCLYHFVSFNRVVINHQKGGIESASSPLVDFGWLNDNTIKRSHIFSKCETRNWLSHRCLMKPKWCVVVKTIWFKHKTTIQMEFMQRLIYCEISMYYVKASTVRIN